MRKSGEIQLEVIAEIFRSDGTLKERRVIKQKPITNKMRIDVLNNERERRVISSIEFPMRSFVVNYAKVWHRVCIRDVDYGTIQSYRAGEYGGNLYACPNNAGAGGSSFGILVGSSNTAVTTTDYRLAAEILHGSGAGQLEYSAVFWKDGWTDGTKRRCQIRRVFTNYSGNDITVREIALVAESGTYDWLEARDVVDANSDPINITLVNNQAMQVIYDMNCETSSGLNTGAIRIVELDSKGVGGTLRATNGNYYSFTSTSITFYGYVLDAPTGDSTYGIVVGTGNSALNLDAYALDAQVTHGSGVGELLYGAYEHEPVDDNGTTMIFAIKRPFVNDSGGTIVLEEAGAYGYGSTSSVLTSIMWARVLLNTITLLNTESVKLTFRFKTSL